MTMMQPTRRAMAALFLLGPALASAQASAAPKKIAKTGQPAAKPQGPEPRKHFTSDDQSAAAISGIPHARFFADSERDFMAATGSADGPWLALSSGGEDGAFGAGLLTGLSANGQRRNFALITGSSTGALMAPYAFLGPRYDEVLRTSYTGINAGDIFEAAGTPESLLDTWPLQKLIEKSVTAAILEEIAAEHRKGRRLFVMTTNMDAGRPVAWNMGEIAAAATPAALKLFRDVLLASSSIPGFFPPVQIGVAANGKSFTEMHADGSIRAPFYVAPESMLAERSESPLRGRQLFVVVNGRLATDFQVIDRGTMNILGRAISLALNAGTRSELVRLATAAARQGASLQVAAVPAEFGHTARGAFDPDYMRALFDFGAAHAKAGRAFGTEAMAALGLPAALGG